MPLNAQKYVEVDHVARLTDIAKLLTDSTKEVRDPATLTRASNR